MSKCLVNFLNLDQSLQEKTRDWRNLPQVAEFFQIDYIPLEVHLKWLESLKSIKPRSVAFMIRVDSNNVGVTYLQRIEYEEKTCDWGIYIHDLSCRGKGLGSWALEECLRYAKGKLGVEKVGLEVLIQNDRGVAVYHKAGFEESKRFLSGSKIVVRMEKAL